VFKEYPIIPDKDGQVGVSLRAAEAALAAKRAGKYVEVHDALMAAPDLDDAVIANVLREHGLGPAQASATPDDLRQLTDVRQLASAIHVGGTPTFVVGDTLVDSSSMPQLAAAIEKARQTLKG
jgi:protein-disulfide isomerase